MRNTHKLVCFLLMLVILVSVVPFSGCALITGEDTSQKDDLFMQLLSLLPASAADRGAFLLIDYDKCFKANGVSLNATNDASLNREQIYKFIFSITEKDSSKLNFIGLGSYYTGFGRDILVSPVSTDNTGYDFTSARAEILDVWQRGLFSRNNPASDQNTASFNKKRIVAAIGDYSTQKMRTAFNNQAAWPPWAIENYSSEDYRNIPVYSWGNADEHHWNDKYDQAFVDEMGRASPIATDNEHLFVASSTDEIKAMIDASQNRGISLADIPEYALVAQSLNDLNVSIAVISTASLHQVDEKNQFVKDYPIIPYLIMGTDIGADEKGSYIVEIFVQLNSTEAKKNVKYFNDRTYAKVTSKEPKYGGWENYFISGASGELVDVTRSMHDYFTEIRIWSQGRVVISKLYTEDSELLYRYVGSR
jgi:hypothetical protein